MDYIWKEFTNRRIFVVGVVYSVIVGLLFANVFDESFFSYFASCFLGWYIGHALVIAARIVNATYKKKKENNG